MRATIALPAGFILLVAERKLFPVADRREPVAPDAERHQVVLHGLGTLGAERQVVLDRAAMVAVPFDFDLRGAVLLQPLRILLQRRALLLGEIVAIVVEMH